MSGEPWTDAQRGVLEENAHLGAERVAAMLERRFGVRRTVKAVRREAERLGVSLYRYETCPACGMAVRSLDKRTGYCRRCHLESLKADNESRYRQLRRQIAEREKESRDGEKQAQRELNAIRSRNHRARKQLESCAKRGD